jgi:3-methyl-2-oxobutanoate hydroxymethyltransferase
MKTIQELSEKKKRGEKITMLTAYDYPTARLLDEAGMDIALVGDSVANVVLGLNSTTLVYMQDMIHHAKAVRRGIKNALLVVDMPYDSYQADPSAAVKNADRIMKEVGCDAVKLEWFKQCPFVAESIVKAGIPVMGHVGLTPQTAESFKVQGKDALTAEEIIRHAHILERVGCFSVVLECIPQEVAQLITEELSIPTIGIGAGVHCDGQVLVTNDLLGLFDGYQPKFAKKYADLSPLILDAFKRYKQDVEKGVFPDPEHSFKMDQDEFKKLKD